MAKPTKIPDWNLDATNNAEPIASRKNSGWIPGEDVPAQWLNWWQRLVRDWIVYLNTITAEALTWTARQIFSAGATVSGSGNGTANAPLRAVSSGASVLSSAHAAYMESNNQLDSTLSLSAKGGGRALYAEGRSGLSSSPAANILHLAKASNNAAVALEMQGALKLTGATNNNVALLNTMVALTMPRAWGFIRYTAGWGLEEGANIASVTVEGLALRVTFAQAMANSYYAVQTNWVVIGTTGVWAYNVAVGNQTATYFEIVMSNFSGVQVDIGALTAGTLGFSFVVFGRQ